MASVVEMAASRAALSELIGSVRVRWRVRVGLYGFMIVIAGTLLSMMAGSLIMDHFRFQPAAIIGVRIVTTIVFVLLIGRYLVLPLRQRVSDSQVALYLEEHEPSLDAVLLSAVEATAQHVPASVRSSRLVDRLLDAAVAGVQMVGSGAQIETKSVRRSLFVIGTLLVAAGVIFGFGPNSIRNGVRFLAIPWKSATAARPYSIAVQPGNAEVARGGDQVIRAQLYGFDTRQTELVVQRDSDGTWERFPMSPTKQAGSFETRLFDIRGRTAYYIEAYGVRSPIYHLDVIDLPYVKKLDLEYHYPSYAGMAPERVENGGDIAALRGTSVTVSATTTMPVNGGRIVIEGKPDILMTLDPDGKIQGALTVTSSGLYKIELETVDGRIVPGSLDYSIDAIEDRPPSITFRKPGRDLHPLAVEEVFTEIEATDDYGVAAVQLRYSVNGGPEQIVPLPLGKSRKDVVAGHTIFFEELHLNPGDLVSYYAQAIDNDNVTGGKSAKTDIYFMDIRSSEVKSKQSKSQQRGRGQPDQQQQQRQEQQDSPGDLSAQQRNIIAGTFKVDRDQAEMSASTLHENLTTLVLAQNKLREQVERLVQQLKERGVADQDSNFKVIAEELPKAIQEMTQASAQLHVRNSRAALAPEQRSLQHLQRAESVYRDQMRQSPSASSSGSQGSQNTRQQQQQANDLADLFSVQKSQPPNQFEPDKGREQQQGATASALKDTVKQITNKLNDLAKRVQRQSDEQPPTENRKERDDRSQEQRQLAQEMEKAAHQLDNMAHQQPQDQGTRQSAQQLRDAANSLRRSAAQTGDAAKSQSQDALDRLNQARQQLENQQQENKTRAADDLANHAARIASQEKTIEQELKQLDPHFTPEHKNAEERLALQKDALLNEIDQLQSRLQSTANDLREGQPTLANKLQKIDASLRQSGIRDSVRASKDLIGTYGGLRLEQQISQQTSELQRQVSGVVSALRKAETGPGQQTAQILDRARDLVRESEALQDRLHQPDSAQQREGEQGNRGDRNPSDSTNRSNQSTPSNQQSQPNQQSTQGGQTARQSPDSSGQAKGIVGQPLTNRQKEGQTDKQSPSNLTPEQIRQLTRGAYERRLDAEALRRELQQHKIDMRELDSAIQQMKTLEHAGTYGTKALAEQLQAAVNEQLKLFEFALRQKVGAEKTGQPVLGGTNDVPDQFRALVAEYYRSLAKSP